MIAELLVKLSWTEEQTLKEMKRTDYIKERIAREILEGYSNFGFWFIRYRDLVQEGYEKCKIPKDEDDEDDDNYRQGSGPGFY